MTSERKVEMTGAQVFISYSHEDDEYVKRLKVHLRPLELKYRFLIWDDKKIEAGEKWKDEIEKNLESAKVVILMISADFLASKFVMDFEYPKALLKARDHGATLLSIIAGPCLFDEFEIADVQAVNSPERTLQDLEENGAEQERVFVECAKMVKKALST